VQNVHILTVSAVEICKQCPQPASASEDLVPDLVPQLRPCTPLRDFRVPLPRMKIPEADIVYLADNFSDKLFFIMNTGRHCVTVHISRVTEPAGHWTKVLYRFASERPI